MTGGLWIGPSLGITSTTLGGSSFDRFPINYLGAFLRAWWTADDPSSIDTSGGLVSQWRDQVSARAVSQGTSSLMPIYSTVSFNGSPGVAFDGADDVLLNAGAHSLGTSVACEMWALVDQQAPPSATPGLIVCYGNAVSARRAIERGQTPTNNAGVRTTNNVPAESIIYNSADFTGRHYVGAQHAATQQVAQDSNTYATQSITLGTVSSTGLSIGASTTPSAYFTGIVRDVLITASLSAQQRTDLGAWLNTRRNP